MKTLMLLTITLFLVFSTNAQVEGLWQYDQVLVGEEVMTPVSKWSIFKDDGTYFSGNGWTQNESGFWDFNEKSITLVMEYFPKDEFGAFEVVLDSAGMTWSRMEEGMQVTVLLSRAEEKPKSPADWTVGYWQEEKRSHTLLIRWDKNYRKMIDGKRTTGYWVFHAHKSEIAMIPHGPDQKISSWAVEVDEKQLRITNVHTRETANYVRRDSWIE